MAALKDLAALDKIQSHIWQAKIPLEIKLSASESRHYDQTEAYLISTPRLSYLPLLTDRLRVFYQDSLIIDQSDESTTANAYFTHDGVPLKPHLPIGLLYDIHVLSTSDLSLSSTTSPASTFNDTHRATPFTITLHFSAPSNLSVMPASSQTHLHDAFINSTKESDFLRSGSAKPIMSLSAIDSQNLWTSTMNNDLPTFARIFASLLPGPTTSTTPWRNVPLRIYLPAAAASPEEDADTTKRDESAEKERPSSSDGADRSSSKTRPEPPRGQVRVVQSQIPPYVSGSSSASTSTASTTSHLRGGQGQSIPQTLGMALHTLLPSLFPSRRTPILAKPLLHGTVVPMNAPLEDLARKACYADGWVNVVVAVTG